VIIAEAKAGEYHDYKNNKYVCGKVAVVGKLRELCTPEADAIAKQVINGDYDEEADEQDKAMIRRDALAGGFNEQQVKELFNV
jgi:hypothetical protein